MLHSLANAAVAASVAKSGKVGCIQPMQHSVQWVSLLHLLHFSANAAVSAKTVILAIYGANQVAVSRAGGGLEVSCRAFWRRCDNVAAGYRRGLKRQRKVGLAPCGELYIYIFVSNPAFNFTFAPSILLCKTTVEKASQDFHCPLKREDDLAPFIFKGPNHSMRI